MFRFWKRKPAVVVPDSVAEATSDADLFAVARGAGVLTEYPADRPGWARVTADLIPTVKSVLRDRALEREARTTEALIAYQRDGDADNAMRVWRGDAA